MHYLLALTVEPEWGFKEHLLLVEPFRRRLVALLSY
jgi:hypothetical protein